MASPSHAAVSQGGGGAPAAAGDLGGDAPLVGNVGQEYVQSALSTSDPVTAIRDIQARGALADPRCRPLLGALDALGLSRAEAHRLVVQRAAEELLARVAALPPDRLLRLLEATFPFIGISDLRAVPLAVLDRLNPVPASFLKQLAVDRELFWELPAGVQRQAWQLDRGLLQAHALPLVAAYTYETATAMQALNMDETLPESGGAPAAGAAPARPATAPRLGGGSAGGPGAGAPRPPRPPLPHLARRNLRAGSAALRRLTAMVGRSEAVYRGVVDLCVARFRSGGGGACVGMQESALCALRSQLLMSLHDHGEAGICAGEGSFHKLAWTLDACLKDGRLDPRRLKELAAFFAPLDVAAPLAAARYQPAPAARAARAPRAARPAPERDNDAESAGAPGGASAAGAPQRELGDAGMALRDPAPFHLLLRQVVRRLEKCVEEAAVPRDDRELAFLTRLLALAVECRGLLRDRHFHFPRERARAGAAGRGAGAWRRAARRAKRSPRRRLHPAATQTKIDADAAAAFFRRRSVRPSVPISSPLPARA
jgi:negative elongation factor B